MKAIKHSVSQARTRNRHSRAVSMKGHGQQPVHVAVDVVEGHAGGHGVADGTVHGGGEGVGLVVADAVVGGDERHQAAAHNGTHSSVACE